LYLLQLCVVDIQGRSVVKDGNRSECNEARKVIEVIICTVDLNSELYCSYLCWLLSDINWVVY